MTDKVIRFPSNGVQADTFIMQIWTLINDLPEDMSVSTVLGCLEIVKQDLLDSMRGL